MFYLFYQDIRLVVSKNLASLIFFQITVLLGLKVSLRTLAEAGKRHVQETSPRRSS